MNSVAKDLLTKNTVSDFENAIKIAPNFMIEDMFTKAHSVVNKHHNILCSLSGGSDSDIMLDLLEKVDSTKNISYVWFNTGLEYQATKEHLTFLENKYQIKIDRITPKKPIPLAVKQYGQPFLSKTVSEMMMRLQKHDFQWEDEPFDVLYKRYPKCKSALEWWCNAKGKNSKFNIKQNTWLKEFIIANPPTFRIANKCCKFAKKDLAKQILTQGQYDLNVVGIRKAEGGARSSAYKSCYDANREDHDNYRPLFWIKNEDKKLYNKCYGVINSRCYSEYGLPRTGCVGCPCARDFEKELEVVKTYEPNLYKAVTTIFKDSYEYLRQYRKFQETMNKKERFRTKHIEMQNIHQLTFEELGLLG